MSSEIERFIKEGVSILDGRFWLRVTPDRLEAYLKSTGDLPIFSPEDKRRLRKELPKLGIVYGLLETPVYEDDRIVVARGTPPKPGKDAQLKLLVDMTRGPKEKEGRMDYREQNTIVCVRAGERIVQKIPPTSGTPGRDVFGKTIPTTPGKDTTFKYGKGLKVSSDGKFLIAERDGVLIKEGRRLQVLPSFILNGDVDWDVGNIHFCGEKLTINGDVKRGFLIEVKGDLEINGRVEDEVTIVVQGNLAISGLVQGENTVIQCEGEACLAIVEYALVSVRGNLCVSDYLLNSRCRVGGNLRLTRTGKIIGGECLVRQSVVVGILGSSAQVNTLVKAGHDELLEKQLEEIRNKILLLQETVSKIAKILKKETYLRAQGLLDKKQENILKKIKESYRRAQKELMALEDEEKALLKKRETLKEAVVQVFQEVYPGVEIWIAGSKFLVIHHLENVIFYRKGKQVLYRKAT